MRSIAFAAALAALATPAASQTVSMHAGETLVIKFDGGRAVVERIAAAEPMTKYEAYVLWRAEMEAIPPGVKTMPPAFVHEGEGPPDRPSITSGRLQLTMRRVPGPEHEGTALFLVNGYSSASRYRAVMNAADRGSAPTDVCAVPAQFPGLEYWPFVIDQIDLSDLRLEPSDGTVQCE